MMALRVVPVTLEQANDYVRRLHRHSRPVVGSKFCVGVARDPVTVCNVCDNTGEFFDQMVGARNGCSYCTKASRSPAIVGVAIVGRPVARLLDDGSTVEITRVCTDGTHNACSMLYAACRKAARAMGYERIFTYTLPDEGGASLRAAGFRLDKDSAGNTHTAWHNRPGRTAIPVGDDLVGGKWRWAA